MYAQINFSLVKVAVWLSRGKELTRLPYAPFVLCTFVISSLLPVYGASFGDVSHYVYTDYLSSV